MLRLIERLPSQRHWAVLMLGGGHFAAAIYKGNPFSLFSLPTPTAESLNRFQHVRAHQQFDPDSILLLLTQTMYRGGKVKLVL